MYLNTFVNTFLYYFQNIVLVHLFHYKFENERNIRHKISSILLYNMSIIYSRYPVAVNRDYLVAVISDLNLVADLGDWIATIYIYIFQSQQVM